jgi:topoisomerase-4 subunit B
MTAQRSSGKLKGKVSRFKGLGEMNPQQLKETTMDPASRSLIKITLPSSFEERQPARDIVDQLIGKDPAKRLTSSSAARPRSMRKPSMRNSHCWR